ncbi:hypothetical protein AVEN_24853-1 [Araneus ventricosus]|uniref:Uncharacterized protein n=1 Tax=Araneus ventricosus TaxID=182803 RepID=A0A4Y2BUP0_ARAVE|nr:hypothetical protein AVEN_24853-1 [Araneus ventricosus]
MLEIIKNTSQRKGRIGRNAISLQSPVPNECESYSSVEKKTSKRCKSSTGKYLAGPLSIQWPARKHVQTSLEGDTGDSDNMKMDDNVATSPDEYVSRTTEYRRVVNRCRPNHQWRVHNSIPTLEDLTHVPITLT